MHNEGSYGGLVDLVMVCGRFVACFMPTKKESCALGGVRHQVLRQPGIEPEAQQWKLLW